VCLEQKPNCGRSFLESTTELQPTTAEAAYWTAMSDEKRQSVVIDRPVPPQAEPADANAVHGHTSETPPPRSNAPSQRTAPGRRPLFRN
jgi:hypothetical protein